MTSALTEVLEKLERAATGIKVLETILTKLGLTAGAVVARELLEDIRCLKR